jgi:hypothetical protein
LGAGRATQWFGLKGHTPQQARWLAPRLWEPFASLLPEAGQGGPVRQLGRGSPWWELCPPIAAPPVWRLPQGSVPWAAARVPARWCVTPYTQHTIDTPRRKYIQTRNPRSKITTETKEKTRRRVEGGVTGKMGPPPRGAPAGNAANDANDAVPRLNGWHQPRGRHGAAAPGSA